ncbi:hypothetical protein DPMN_009621 [Dreissena polymorpha]|uniref:Uncharacterized protein n=1 Tax=Dreissena polymorpha TaxID=45954 RepID=A0A9D4N0S8_DREPO|nr:hypothetical protein DPMN_009621 [Dreissena polymorpha]
MGGTEMSYQRWHVAPYSSVCEISRVQGVTNRMIPEAKQHIKSAKERRKIPPKQPMVSASAPVLTLVDAGVQTDVTEGNDELSLIKTPVDIAIQKLNLESKEYDAESDSEFSDDVFVAIRIIHKRNARPPSRCYLAA